MTKRAPGFYKRSLWLAIVCYGLLAPSRGLAQEKNPTGASEALLLSLNSRLADSYRTIEPGLLQELLAIRAALLSELIVANPSKALEAGLPVEIAEYLRQADLSAPVEMRGEWEGTLQAIVEDDFEHKSSRTRWYLYMSGHTLELHFAAPAVRSPGSLARVGGVRLREHIAVASVTMMPGEAAAGTPDQCTTTGPQNIAVVMVTRAPAPNFPAGFTPALLQQLFFSDTDQSLNTFWQASSYGQTSATGQVFGPYQLGADVACDSNSVQIAALTAAGASLDITKFKRLVVVSSLSCSLPPNSTVGCVKATPYPNMSVAWLPYGVVDKTSLNLVAHELGHNLGLAHANSDDYGAIPLGAFDDPGTDVEYGDPFSVMGNSLNFGGHPVMGDYSAPHKSLLLKWLGPADYRPVDAPGTFTIAPYESTTGTRALRIRRDLATNTWLWLEYRQPIGFDSTLSLYSQPQLNVFGGALVHYETPLLYSLRTNLLDFHPSAAPNNFLDAALVLGQSWADPYSPLTLQAISGDSKGMTVNVSYDPSCVSLQASSTFFPQNAGSGTIRVSAPAGCQWTASSGAGWIVLSGPTSGAGNGTIGFSVASNNALQQRSAPIVVARQSTSIRQAGTGATVVGVTPSTGSGNPAQFTFQFSHSQGWQNIKRVDLYFGLSDVVVTTAWPNPGGWFYLAYGSSVYFGTPGASTSDGVCTVYSDGSSMTGAGNTLTVTLQISCSAASGGPYSITATASGSTSGDYSPTIMLGTWDTSATVPPSCVPGFSPEAYVDALAQTLPVNITAGAGCTWTFSSDTDWITIGAPKPISGSAPLPIGIAANNTGAARTSTVTIGGGTLTVTQRQTASVFGDLPLSNDFFDAANLLYGRSVTSGCGSPPPAPLQYCPGANVTRSQMAVFVVRSMMGGDNFTYTLTPYFSDVASIHPYFPWIQKLRDLGVTSSCGSTATGPAYCPDDPVTRDQMAVFIIRDRFGASTTFNYPPTPLFTDVPVSNGFFSWIQKLKQLGITSSCGSTAAGPAYCPGDPVTRGQMAVFIMRGAFNQLLPANTPMIVSVSPATASPGQTITVTLRGQNTNFAGGATQVIAGAGITVSNISVKNGTTLTAQLSIGANGVLGPHSIIATTGAEEATLPNGFLVQ